MKRLIEMILGPKKTHAYYLNQGDNAFASGDYVEAEKEYSRALEMAQEARAHDVIARSSGQLAVICERTDRLAVAETHYRRAFQTEEDSEHFGNAAQLLVMLGRLYHKMRRIPDAEQVLQYAMSMYQQHYSAQHPGIANGAVTLADCYLDRKNYPEAETLLVRAIAIDERENGLEHVRVIESIHKLALALDGQGKTREAEETFRRATESLDRKNGDLERLEAHKFCACYHDFGRFYLKQDKIEQAQVYFKKAVDIAEKYPGYLDEADLADKVSC